MEKNSHYFIIGVFVSVALVTLSLFVIWLAGSHDSRNYERYTIYFDDPVSGLKESALVQYRGVAVGFVRDMRLSPEQNDLIKVDIEVDSTAPVFKSTRATLGQQGFTGIIFIELTTQDGDTEPAITKDNEQYPVIPGSGTQLSKLFEDIPQISKQILDLSEKLNTVFNEETITSLQNTIKNVEQMSADMNGLLSEQNVANASTAMSNLATTSESLDELVKKFNNTADEIDQAANTLNSVLTNNRGDIDKFMGTGLSQITEMSRETKEMAVSIRRLADRLEQDPSRIIYQPNYRGVEIQK
jgi:phospholipid/cholesterol/gamma-HCH transport system substrate-binding protein